jgi:hypothetical protein
MANIRYYRIMKAADGGVWGELTVGGEYFVGVENRSNTDPANPFIGYDSVPAGTYQLEMSKKNNDPDVQCLRFVEIPSRTGNGNPFLIHRAKHNIWRGKNLAGCIAPGFGAAGTGQLQKSDEAMKRIFELLGGYGLGKKVTIEIANNAPGDTWTKDEFITRRSQGLPT